MPTDEIMNRCKRCYKEYPMKKLHLDIDGRTWLCLSCLSVERGQKNKGRLPEKKEPIPMLASKTPPASGEKMVGYHCRCGYKFRKPESKVITKCPYCGKGSPDLARDEPLDKILQESQGKKYDWG
jgi:hypothetical protein